MRSTLAALVLAIAGSSCVDPVHDDAVDALGDEAPGVRPGPTHRPGQPCLTCHGGDGPGEPEMSIGGTVYAVRAGTEGIADVSVIVTDAKGGERELTTNSVGNFYMFKSEWEPVFPLTVTVAGAGAEARMKTTIGRDGACATCHRGAGDARRMPGVYLRVQ